MWSFPGIYANRGSGTDQASSDVEQGTGIDLRCGGGHLGLQGAPGALPSALGFESLPGMKNAATPSGATAFLARLEGFEPPTFWSVARHSIQLS